MLFYALRILFVEMARRRKTPPKGLHVQRPEADLNKRKFRENLLRDHPGLHGREGLIERLYAPTRDPCLHPLEILERQRSAIFAEADRPGLTAEQMEALEKVLASVNERIRSITSRRGR